MKPADVVVGMESCLEAADGVRFIKEGAASTHTSLSNIATLGAPSYFGVQSELQNLWTGTGADLRNRAHVYGFVQSSLPIGKQIDTIVDGPVTENAVLTPYEVQRWTVTYPATSLGTVSLEPNQSRSPAPGSRYDDYFVKSNATLHLEPGTYYFNSLVIEPSARLEVQNATGSVQVYVRQGFILRGVLAESQAKANTLFALASRADEPMAVFDIESPFHGLVVAPHGFINLGTTSTGHVGSFYGAGFRANPWTPIYQRPTDPNYITSIRCRDGTRDGDESDVDCGGSCGPCSPGGGCSQASDCGSGMACGFSNGACFGGVRAKRVCWPAQCEDGIDPEAGECGQANSPCGQNCACVTSCDSSSSNTCPAGEQCAKGMGGPLGASTPDVCLDPSCPSNSPPLCGGDGTLCGPCICTPGCSHATCASPGDGCGGLCPAVCPIGGSGSGGPNCTTDLTCPAGAVCLTNQDGSRTCRPAECATASLVPPLCGSPTAPCGTQCPTCVAACDGRVCGADPMCGASCGTCSGDTHCDATGQCVSTPPETPPTIPDGNGGQKPVTPLPHVDASAVGAVPGAFSVSEAGTAEYTVPIEVPPGRAGLEPSLSLRYAGTRVNGDLGTGWTLEGLSKITRCPHTYAVDGYAGPITNTVTDALCLDGKRLRNVGGAASPSIGNPAEYRTLIDSFAKIVGYQTDDDVGVQLPPFASILRVIRGLQGADYFKVWTKDGRILTYGGAADSLIMSRNGVRNTWLLTRVEDRAGNNIIITYENAAAQLAPDGGLSLVRPKLIAYTVHGATAGNREVRFSYETRPDTNVRYFQGAVGWLVQERLARVTTYVRGAPVKNYRLVYSEQNTSQIEKVFECEGDSDGRCKAPTTFTYAAESGFDLGFSPVKAEAAVQLDVDGNGIPDFLETEVTVNGVAARPEYKAAEIGADIAVGIATSFMTFGTGLAVTAGYTVVKIVALGLLAEDPKITYKSNLWLGNGGRTDKSYAVWIQDVKGIPCQGKQIVFYDYDRDGKDDAVGVCNDNRVYVARSDGSGNFQPFPDSKPVATLPVVWIPFTDGKVASRGPAPVFIDVDGDSLEDIVDCTDPKTLEVRRRSSPGGGFATPVAVSGSSSGYCGQSRPTVLPFDVDGDGASDLLLGTKDGWQVLRYERALTPGSTASISWKPISLPNWQGSENGKGLTLADLNGDGLLDIWSAGKKDAPSDAAVWLNQGGGGFQQKFLQRPRPSALVGAPDYRVRLTGILDHDGDGRPDILDDYDNGSKNDNWALHFDTNFTQLTPQHADDLYYPLNGQPWQMRVGIVTDVDGDGNVDVMSDGGQVRFGKGTTNLLLKRIVDGVGNYVDIEYDNQFGSAYTNDCSGSDWPEPCLKTMRGLVRYQRTGVVDANGSDVLESTSTYGYRNGRMSATGHGWLGFDSRTVSIEYPGVGGGKKVATEYYPPIRTSLAGDTLTSATPPFIYPFAGFTKSITVDEFAGISAIESPADGGGFRRRTRTTSSWDVGLPATAHPLPFPRLRSQTTSVYERPLPAIVIGDPPPDIEDGALLMSCTQNFTGYDAHGNLLTELHDCTDAAGLLMESGGTTSEYQQDEAAWLVSNPTHVTITSQRANWGYTRTLDLTYDARGLLETVTRALDDPNGDVTAFHRTTYVRNPHGNPEHIWEDIQTGEPRRTTDVTYDADQVFPYLITNSKGHTTQLDFDPAWGAVASVVDPNNIITQRQYDGLGLLVTSTDPGGTTAYTYAAATSKLATTPAGTIHPRIQVTRSRQGKDGTHSGGLVTELDYRNRVVRTQGEAIAQTTVIAERAYDSKGRLIGSTLPHTTATASSQVPSALYQYDGLDRLIALQRSDGSLVQHRYADAVTLADAHRQWLTGLTCSGPEYQTGCPIGIEQTIDETGRENVVITDHGGHPLRNVDGENTATPTTDRYVDFYYGGFNTLQLVKDVANGAFKLDQNEYDHYGRQLIHFDRNGVGTQSQYNGFDEITATQDTKGQTRTYNHDELGRLTSIQDTFGESRWLYDEGPNALGRLTGTISPATAENLGGQRQKYIYEPPTADPLRNRGALQRVEHVIDGANYSMTFEYDDLARPKRVHYPSADSSLAPPVIAEYLYDGSGALTGLDEIGSSATRQLWRLTEAYQGQLIQSETFGNNAASAYQYDPQRYFIKNITTTLPSTAPGNPTPNTIQSLAYDYYANGRVQTRTDSTEASATLARGYTYDLLNRLDTITEKLNGATTLTTHHAYDPLGNLTARGATTTVYDPARPHFIQTVTATGTNTYAYDDNGNVTSRLGADIPGGSQTIDYTTFDMPRTITSGTGEATTIDYDANESRVALRSRTATRHYISDYYQHTFDSTTHATTEERIRLYAGGRTLGEIVRTPGAAGTGSATAERTIYFHGDQLDSVDTVSTSDGTFTRQAFDAFGVPTDPLTATRSGFTGHQHDQDLGLIDMRGRVYDPLAARFLTQDPVRSAPYWTQGQNPYSYVFNDPINATDPSGFIADNWDSTAGIEGWGVGLTAASVGADFGGMLVGGGANVATSIGLNALMGDPFAGSASRSTTGAIGQRVAGVKGGGNGGNAVGQNRGEPAAVRMGGPGSSRPSLFDPEAGALACNAGGDVCIELLRQQRDAQWKIAQENIKAVEDAEWELFWAYTGAQAVKLARWAWVGVKAWRAARASSAAADAGRHIALGWERFGLSELAEKIGAETLLRDR